MDENFPGMGTYRKYLKPEIVDMQIPLKTIYEMGGIICGSSDAPVQDISPFLQIHGMVNFPIVNERLSVYQAFRTYTYYAAYATFEENIRGTLSEGKLADFVDGFFESRDHVVECLDESTDFIFAVIGEERLQVHAAGRINDLTEHGSEVRFGVEGWHEPRSWVLVHGCPRRPRVVVNGEQLGESVEFVAERGSLLFPVPIRAEVRLTFEAGRPQG